MQPATGGVRQQSSNDTSGAVYVPQPPYTWNPVSGATQYHLATFDSIGNRIDSTLVDASGVCPAGSNTCSITTAKVLAIGNYAWTATAKNGPSGATSSAMAFSVSGPGVPAPISPSTAAINARPTFTWSRVEGATQYWLFIDDLDENTPDPIYQGSVPQCDTANCSATPALIGVGWYRWRISARNMAGWSADSAFMNFGVLAPAAPVQDSPNGSIATGRRPTSGTRPKGPRPTACGSSTAPATRRSRPASTRAPCARTASAR